MARKTVARLMKDHDIRLPGRAGAAAFRGRPTTGTISASRQTCCGGISAPRSRTASARLHQLRAH
ncbi:hypothetical protein [Rhodovulum sp. MB263]|uniref:hypothetical protein n=1 Tax=Rhodovulum sp. (strain MB263) TaxID=308754 RepID=UPI0018C8B22F